MSNDLSLSIGFHNKEGKFRGLQIGIGPYAEDMEGLQVGLRNGGCEEDKEKITGAQVGIGNFAEYSKGIQVGCINISYDMKGMQVGLLNGSDGKVLKLGIINFGGEGGKGVQVGVLNYNYKISGLDIGLINYGEINPEENKNRYIQLGLFNIRRKEIKGKKHLEVTPLIGWYNLK